MHQRIDQLLSRLSQAPALKAFLIVEHFKWRTAQTFGPEETGTVAHKQIAEIIAPQQLLPQGLQGRSFSFVTHLQRQSSNAAGKSPRIKKLYCSASGIGCTRGPRGSTLFLKAV